MPDPSESLALFVLVVRAMHELVPLVLLAPDACGLSALLVLLVPAVGGSFMLVLCFQVFAPLVLQRIRHLCCHPVCAFLIGARFMVSRCCCVVVIVCVCLVCCCCCWLLRSVWLSG